MLMHKNIYPCGWARRIPLSYNPIRHIKISRKAVLRNTPWDKRGGAKPRIDGEVDGVDPWDFFQWPQCRMIGFYVKKTGWERESFCESFCYHEKELIFHSSTLPFGSAMRSFPTIRMCSFLLEVLLSSDN